MMNEHHSHEERTRNQPFCVGETAVVRIAGMPVSLLADLRCERTLRSAHDLLKRDKRHAIESRELSDLLYVAVSEVRDKALKFALLELRRAVYNGAGSRISGCVRRAAHGLPPDVAKKIRELRKELQRRDSDLKKLENLLSDEILSKVPLLRTAATNPRFRHGLAQSGSRLTEAVDKWISRTSAKIPDSRLLIRVALYLSRMMAKTSPYSTFTTVGLANWCQSGPALRFRPDVALRGVLTLDVRILRRIERSLAALPAVREDLGLRLNPSATLTADVVCFLGTSPTEPIVRMTLTPEVMTCIDLAGSSDWARLREVRRKLANTTTNARAETMSQRYLNKLIDVGLLELRLPVSDQSEDPLEDIAVYLDGIATPYCRHVSRACRRLRAEVVTPTQPTSVMDHRKRLAALKSRAAELQKAAGLGGGVSDASGNTTYEDMVFTRSVLECSRECWDPALEDLDVIRRWFAIHDPQLPLRLTLATYHRDRFGPGTRIPFVSFYDALQKDLHAPDPNRSMPPSFSELETLLGSYRRTSARPLPRVAKVEQFRQRAIAQMLDHPVDGDGIIRVPPSLLRQSLAHWPEYVSAPSSIACYVQPIVEGDQARLVLNAMLSGHGRGVGRWLQVTRRAALASGTSPLPDWVVPFSDGGGAVSAESRGTFGTGLNLRPPVAAYEIEYPGVVSDRDSSKRIPLRDISVAHDSRLNTVNICCDALARKLEPVHGGMLVEALLPPALRLLLRGFSSPTLHYPTVPLFLPRARPKPGTVLFFPRLDVGLVTLRRACWLVERQALPRRHRRQPDSRYFLEMHRWLCNHLIPSECFVRLWTAAETSLAPGGRKRHKPIFVDFANWFLLRAFDRMVRSDTGKGDDLFMLEEAYPAPTQALAPGPSQCEFIVEITGK